MFDKKYFERESYKSYKDMKIIEKLFFKVLKDTNISSDAKIRVLDIGCAFGYFLKLCDRVGYKTYGIDISEYAINIAKSETRAQLYVHDVDKGLVMFKDNFFDLVIMFDIIEHLKSPYLVLKEVYRVLKPNGHLIITTPNLNAIDRFFKKIIGKETNWYGYYDKTHYYLFTPASLKFLVRRVGFEVRKIETPFYFLPKLLQKIVNKTMLGGQIWCVAKKK